MISSNSHAATRAEGSLTNRLAEYLILVVVCVAPWLLGAVQARSELLIFVVIASVAVVVALSGQAIFRWRNLLNCPSLAMLGLVSLGFAQSASIPERVLALLDPSTSSLRQSLLPDSPEHVLGDFAEPVDLTAPTISQEPGATRAATTRLFAAWLLFQVVLSLDGKYDSLRRFGWVIALNCAALALFAIVQALTWNGKIYWTIPVLNEGSAWSAGGPFVCHTHLSEYLNLGLGIGIGLLFGGAKAPHAGDRSQRALALYVVVVIVLGIITSQSRGGFLSMVAASSLAILCLRSRGLGFWLPIGGSLLLLVAFFFALGDVSPFIARLATVLDSRETGYHTRLQIWEESFRGWKAHPFLGTGLGTFAVAEPLYANWDRSEHYFHAEDEYVEMLLEGGLVGFGIAIIGLGGFAWLARRAWSNAVSPADRTIIIGSCSGVLAVAFQCVSDFGLHIPAVSYLLVVLCGHLCRIGLTEIPEVSTDLKCRPGWARLGQTMLVLVFSGAMVSQAVKWARCEALVTSVKLPAPDSFYPTPTLFDRDIDELETLRSTLAVAVRLRPDWTEGHIRQGLVELSLYRATANDWLSPEVTDPIERAQLADPLWLLKLVHDGQVDAATLVEQEPIREYLIPAARSFLQARKSSLVASLANAELGALSWIIEPKTKPEKYIERALLTAGANTDLLAFAAQVALVSDDPLLAARCWRRALEVGGNRWVEIAEAAGGIFSPEQILEKVISETHGRFALMFAERLYSSPQDREKRDKLLRVAVARLPQDLDLPIPERLWLVGRALSELEDRTAARRAMDSALALEPTRFEWRKELIEALIRWGDPEEAHQQAILAFNLSPLNQDARKLVDLSAEALARGAEFSEAGSEESR